MRRATRGPASSSSSRLCTPRLPTRSSSAVQHLDGGPRVGQRPVVGPGGGAEQLRPAPPSRTLGASSRRQHRAGQPGGAQHRRPRPAAARAARRRPAGTRRRTGRCAPPARRRAGTPARRQHRGERRRARRRIAVVIPVSATIVRRDAGARVDQRGQLADPLAAAHLDRADLGDRVRRGAAAGGLQVEHDEGDLAQRGAQLVEGELRRAEPGGDASRVTARRAHAAGRRAAPPTVGPPANLVACPGRGPPDRGGGRCGWDDAARGGPRTGSPAAGAPRLPPRTALPARPTCRSSLRRLARFTPGQAGPARRRSRCSPSWRTRRRSGPPSSPGGRSTARASSAAADDRRPADRGGGRRAGRRAGRRRAVAAAARRAEAAGAPGRAGRRAGQGRQADRRARTAARRADRGPRPGPGGRAGQRGRAEYQQLRRKVSEQGARLRARGRRARRPPRRRWPSSGAPRTDGAGRGAAERDRERGPGRDASGGAPTGPPPRSPRRARPPARPGRPTRCASTLLLDTVGGAVAGLRRELALGGGGGRPPRPADLVAGASGPARGGRVDDVVGLDALLVAAVGAPDRRRLQRQQDRLPRADRWPTSATGWSASSPRSPRAPAWRSRWCSTAPRRAGRRRPGRRAGVRVLFSDPGVLADDVIRALVAAEPEGRPVVVATSDRAVVDSVLRARRLPAAVGGAAGPAGAQLSPLRRQRRRRNCRCGPAYRRGHAREERR